MRIPVAKHTIVVLTLAGILLTALVAVGLAYPGLMPGAMQNQLATDPAPGGEMAATDQQPVATPKVVTVVITPDQSSARAGIAPVESSTVDAEETSSARRDTAGSPPQPQSSSTTVTTRTPPTPNPDFTPAVKQESSVDGDDEYEDEDGSGDEDGYEDDEEYEEEDEDEEEDEEAGEEADDDE